MDNTPLRQDRRRRYFRPQSSSQHRMDIQWRHNGRDGVSNHRRIDSFSAACSDAVLSKNTSKLRATGLCEANLPVTGEFPSQRPSNAENVSIRWRNHGSCWNRHQEWTRHWQSFIISLLHELYSERTTDALNIFHCTYGRKLVRNRVKMWKARFHAMAPFNVGWMRMLFGFYTWISPFLLYRSKE